MNEAFVLVPGHEGHLCLDCRGVVLPKTPLGENHVAVRFDDDPRSPVRSHAYRYDAYLNGEKVSSDCTEAFAGRDGWVALYHTAQWCQHCGKGICHYIERGEVRIESCR